VAGVRCGSGLVLYDIACGPTCNDYRYMYWLVTAGFGRKLDTMEAVERVPISRFQGGSAACAPGMLPTVTATITMYLLHRLTLAGEHFSGRRSVRNEKVSLTTTLITRLLTDPLANSRSRADARDQSPGSGPATTHVDCRWHGRGHGSNSEYLADK
jgi:hypothetical protein